MGSPSSAEYLKNRPSLEEFRSFACAQFAFLVSEFGFTEEPLPIRQFQNQFEVRFISPACRVVVEGRNFGAGVSVIFERLAGGWARLFDILAIRCLPALEPLRHFGDQRELLRLAASTLRQHALDVLRGEPEIYRAAEAYRHKMNQSRSTGLQ